MTKKMIVFATVLSSLFFAGCDQNPNSVLTVDQSEKTAWCCTEVPENDHWRKIGAYVEAPAGGYYIYKWTNNNGQLSWDKFPTGAAVKIAVDPNGTTWVINSYKNIFRYVNNTWEVLPGYAQEIAIGWTGAVYIIGTTAKNGGYNILKWNESSRTWVQTYRGAGVKIAVDYTGNPWVITNNDYIFKTTDGGENWTILPNINAKEITIKSGRKNGVFFEAKWVLSSTPLNNGYCPAIWNGNTFVLVYPNDGNSYSPRKIALSKDCVPFIIEDDYDIWYSGDGGYGWTTIRGGAREMCFGGTIRE
jgi:hypothetical protein